MKKFLKQMDSFQQQDHLLVTKVVGQGQSTFGGLMTFSIFILSFAFFIYQITEWLQNNKLPKITQNITYQEELNFVQSQTLAQFEFYRMRTTDIDPFDPENLIIQAILEINENDAIKVQGQVPYAQEKSFLDGYVQVLQNVSLQLLSKQDGSSKFRNYQIIFRDCQEKYLKQGQQCADQILKNKFYSQTNKWILLTIYQQQLNSKTQQVQSIPIKNYIYLQQNKTYYQDTSLQIADCQLDIGFLFSSIQNKQFLISVTNSISELPIQYSLDMYGLKTSFIWYLGLSQLYTEQYVEYPKIQEILANVGSIVSILFLLQIFPQTYNKNKLKSFYLNEIIKIYYPDFADLNINCNIFGKIVSIDYKGKQQIDLKFDIWKKTYLQLKKIAEEKCCFLNLQYEFLFLQQLLQNIPYKQMKITHLFQEIANQIDPSNSRQVQQAQNETINIFSQNENLQNFLNDYGLLCQRQLNNINNLNNINIE